MAIGKEAVDQIEQALLPKIQKYVEESSAKLLSRLNEASSVSAGLADADGVYSEPYMNRDELVTQKSRLRSDMYDNQTSPFGQTSRSVVVTDADIRNYTWYHGNLDRGEATSKLMRRHKNGMFLVRKSSRSGCPYTLSLFYEGRVFNVHIRHRPDNSYALGNNRPDEKGFATVADMILYFQHEPMVLNWDAFREVQTTLLQALPM